MNASGVIVARLQGHSWAPTPSRDGEITSAITAVWVSGVVVGSR
jgi:hypothetical protein